jgi:hypothetical protein
MARARRYRNNAERQAAYRARWADRQGVSPRLLATLGQELHGRLRQAVEGGRNQVPATVLGKRADETLINLIRYATRGLDEEEAPNA